ncbi:hypothetical protein [Thiohalorhabdus methylotrophus]|uniref:Uncharacterized protein n=1 Tax=Thiohalorhabdus methylotrophus TaxID=3242694 RepID=A0ABV4TU74_9GAMM
MAMAQPQQSPNIMSMAIRDPHRGLYQVAFNDGVSGVRVEVPFEEAASVREARIKAEHTLQYQEWLRHKRLREHRIRQLVGDYNGLTYNKPVPGSDDLTDVDPDGLADHLIDRFAEGERRSVSYGVGAMLRHTLVLLEAAHRLRGEGEWSLSYAYRMLEDLRLIRRLGESLTVREVEKEVRLEDAVRYWNAIKDGHLSPAIRDQLRRRAKAWLRRYMSHPD